MNTPRYQGKPLLRLLECYVLKTIGHLSQQDFENLTAIEPKLAQIYGVDGSWDHIIAAIMNMPPSMPELIYAAWEKNNELAVINGTVLGAQQFAEMFVDQNLA